MTNMHADILKPIPNSTLNDTTKTAMQNLVNQMILKDVLGHCAKLEETSNNFYDPIYLQILKERNMKSQQPLPTEKVIKELKHFSFGEDVGN